MALFDKLSKRTLAPVSATDSNYYTKTKMSTIASRLNKPSGTMIPATTAVKPATMLTTTSVADKLTRLPEKGIIGSMPQWNKMNKRFVADLPATMQLNAIMQILTGQDSNSPEINNFVKELATQGKTPEEIRQAFIMQQKASPNPLVIL